MLIVINPQVETDLQAGRGGHKLFFIFLRASGIFIPTQVALVQVSISPPVRCLPLYSCSLHKRTLLNRISFPEKERYSFKSLFHNFPSPASPMHTFRNSCSNLVGVVVMEGFVEGDRSWGFKLYSCNRNAIETSLIRKEMATVTHRGENRLKNGGQPIHLVYHSLSGTCYSTGYTVSAP